MEYTQVFENYPNPNDIAIILYPVVTRTIISVPTPLFLTNSVRSRYETKKTTGTRRLAVTGPNHDGRINVIYIRRRIINDVLLTFIIRVFERHFFAESY